MEMQWNLQCGIMWNQYEPQQEYVPLRGLSAICGTTCPMHFQLRLRALALRCSKAKQGELGIAFKENDREKLVMTSEKPFATASLESLFDVFPVFLCGRSLHLDLDHPLIQGLALVSGNGPNESHSNWENFRANFAMTYNDDLLIFE